MWWHLQSLASQLLMGSICETYIEHEMLSISNIYSHLPMRGAIGLLCYIALCRFPYNRHISVWIWSIFKEICTWIVQLNVFFGYVPSSFTHIPPFTSLVWQCPSTSEISQKIIGKHITCYSSTKKPLYNHSKTKNTQNMFIISYETYCNYVFNSLTSGRFSWKFR